VRIKLDENIPIRLAPVLSGLGHDVDTVSGEKLTGRADPQVWAASQNSARFLITQDLDFSDIRQFTPGQHWGLLLVRFRDPGREAIFRRLCEVFRSEDLERWGRCFVVVTERKIRVRRP
jgi:predicted nuclease of predicted toxin-antitoxin system